MHYSNIKAVIIGCGRMGFNHALALQKLGIQLIAISDKRSQALDQFINSHELKNTSNIEVFCDYKKLLSLSKADLAIISTTCDTHAEIGINACTNGFKRILLEKPITNSLLSCKELEHTASKYGSIISVNHQMRFLPQYQIPKDLSNSIKYGGLTSMHVTAGNFGLAMNGTHYMEAFRFITDEEPIEVSAWFDNTFLSNPRGDNFKDVSGSIRVLTRSGKRLYIDASADQGHGVQVTYMSRNGRITIDELQGSMSTVVRESEHQDAPTSRYGMPATYQQEHIKAIELVDSTKDVLDALLKSQNYPTLNNAATAIKALVAAYQSHRMGGKTIKLEDISDHDPEVFAWA